MSRIQCQIKFPDEGPNAEWRDLDLGSTITRQYNETLDTAQANFSNVPASKRLQRVKPYSFAIVRIAQGSDSRNFVFLVDSVAERSNLISDGEAKYYSYEVALMSPTKLLEKVQLPNRAYTHPLTGERKTVRQAVQELCDLYMPRIKAYKPISKTWEYQPVISCNTALFPEWRKMDIPCADLSMSEPTLRQALTSLMIQAHCLPKVEGTDLSFIDLDAEPTPLDEAGINGKTESNASDSYVTKLVAAPSQLLDEDNAVVNEVLGFRDRDRVFLKANENLRLETRFPIYSVESAKARFYRLRILNARFGSVWQGDSTDSNISAGIYVNDAGEYTLQAVWKGQTEAASYSAEGEIIQINAHSGRWEIMRRNSFLKSFSTTSGEGLALLADGIPSSEYPKQGDPDYGWVFTLSRTRLRKQGEEAWGPWLYSADCGPVSGAPWSPKEFVVINQTLNFGAISAMPFVSLWEKDVTPLFVESSKRSLLNTDYLAMPSSISSVAELSSWLYGTVGYSIGSNAIEGFSQTYSKSNGVFASEKTYLENILELVYKMDPEGDRPATKAEFFGGPDSLFGGAIPEGDVTFFSAGVASHDLQIVDPWDTTKVATAGSGYPFVFFDIRYVPLMDAKLSFPKKTDHQYEVEQYDSSENGVSASRAFGLAENEKVSRLGNAVLSAHRRVSSLAEWDALGDGLNRTIMGKDGPCTVFSETITLNGSAIDVAYAASRDYVLKNYFTSVVTKYRAYQNVDYSRSVTRKECFLVYADLEPYYYDGDDRIYFGALGSPESVDEQFRLIDAPIPSGGDPYSYGFQQDPEGSATYISELSILAGEARLAFTVKDHDNASMGNYLTKRATGSDGAYADASFGAPQSWYPNASLSESRAIGFTRGTGYFTGDAVFANLGGETGYGDYMLSAISTPKIAPAFLNPRSKLSGFWFLGSNGHAYGSSVEALKVSKDNAELLQTTVQLEYVSLSGRCRIFEGFARASSAAGRLPTSAGRSICFHTQEPRGYYLTEDDAYYQKAVADSLEIGEPISKGTGSTGHASLVIDWDKVGADTLTVTAVTGFASPAKLCTDLISFKAPDGRGKEEWFLSFDDTNTMDVCAKSADGQAWGVRAKVKKNGDNRGTDGV